MGGGHLYAAYLVVQWIFLSSCLILYNQHLIAGGFRHPVTLVLCHMIFGILAASSWRALGWERVPPIDLNKWIVSFLPVGVFFAASLVLSNMAYTYISVAYIQMIKASTPVVVLVLSFAFRIERPSLRLLVYIVLISSGVTLSCYANVETSAIGTLMQLAALLCEGVRLVLVNLLLTSKGLKLSPIASLFYIAPACFLCLIGPWAVLEAPYVLADSLAVIRQAGAVVLISNSSVAFLLNLATLALIKQTSALTLNIAGVCKDVLLIAFSVAVHGAVVTPLQYLGYGIAMAGVVAYTLYKHRQASGAAATAAAATDSPQKDNRKAPLASMDSLEAADAVPCVPPTGCRPPSSPSVSPEPAQAPPPCPATAYSSPRSRKSSTV